MPASVDITAASISKQGHQPDENEDAWAVRSDAGRVQACVADGATESVYAGLWAQALVQAFASTDAASTDAASTDAGDRKAVDQDGRRRPVSDAYVAERMHEAIARARAAWSETVDGRADAVPWYVEAKRQQGAFATVLGLLLVPTEPGAASRSAGAGRFAAAAVGDCGLFRYAGHERDTGASEPYHAWPESDPEAFTHRPALVSSRQEEPPAGDRAALDGTVRTVDGTWEMGDTFVIATDAVAAWLLRENPELPASDAEAERQLREAQASGHLRNDDSTIVIFRTRPA